MSKPEIKNTMHAKATLKLYWEAAWLNKKECILFLAHPVSIVLLGVLMPFYASRILAGLLTQTPAIWHNFYTLVAVTFFGIIFNQIGIKSAMTLEARSMETLHVRAFEHLMQRSVGFYNNQVGGKLVSEVADFAKGFTDIGNSVFISGINIVITSVVGLVIIFIGSWVLGLSLLGLLSVLTYWSVIETKQRSDRRAARLRMSRLLISHLSDSIVNAVTVKTFAQEEHELEQGKTIARKLREIRVRDWGLTVTNEGYRMCVLLSAQLVMIFALIKISRNNPHVLATGIFAFSYTISLINRFFTINPMVRTAEEALLQSSEVTRLLGEDVEIRDAAHAERLQVTDGAINFSKVGFHYADAADDQKVFDTLNLNIRAGEKIGLVGHSGGGKTTLTRLLLRFDDVTEGAILIDGQNIADVTQTSLRSHIAYVPQEPLLFHRSIEENIAYGSPHAGSAAVIAAAKMAHSHDFITALPNGYETIVGERGVKLSGGQRQRVAIARAILKDAPILVLDEATSALDSESESYIQDALWKLMEGRTAIVIAHRLSTIQKMDRIIVLDEGTIVEEGSHKALLKNKGIYAKLWGRQSGGFLDE